MALPDVKISRKTGKLKRSKPTTDNVFGLAVSGVAVVDKIALGEPKLLTGTDSLTALGITAANNPLAFDEVNKFYDKAGEGTEVWLMLFSDAMLLADLCDVDAGLLRSLVLAGGSKIRGIFVNKILPEGYVPVPTEGLDADVWNGVTKLQAFCESFGEANDPMFGVLPGFGFAKATIATLRDLKTMTANQVGILLGADTADGKFSIGTLAGWLAKLPVNRSAARVLEGSVLESAWLGDGTAADDVTIRGLLDGLHDKRYIFYRKIKGKSGFFFNDDPTACSVDDDYSSISWNRVINKAHTITYDKLVNHLNDDVDTDEITGGISPTMASDWEGEVEREITLQMVNKKEITGVKCFIDPAQSNLATDQIAAELTIVRKGQAKTINVAIGYAPVL